MAGTSRLGALICAAPTMVTATHWFQAALDRLDRPLALLVVAVFLLALRRAER